MRFLYSYKTSENERRDGVIIASSRDAVYEQLKKSRIRPFRVELAPGFWNRVQGVGKRWMAISVLVVLVVALGLALILGSDRLTGLEIYGSERRQLIGDAFVIESGIRSAWTMAFDNPGDRYLASFAIPGVPSSAKASDDDVEAALSKDVVEEQTDCVEVRQIKAIVRGMKDEARQFLRDGGTIAEYRMELQSRQQIECRCRERASMELEMLVRRGGSKESVVRLWEKRNRELRKIGVHTVTMPDFGTEKILKISH